MDSRVRRLSSDGIYFKEFDLVYEVNWEVLFLVSDGCKALSLDGFPWPSSRKLETIHHEVINFFVEFHEKAYCKRS